MGSFKISTVKKPLSWRINWETNLTNDFKYPLIFHEQLYEATTKTNNNLSNLPT